MSFTKVKPGGFTTNEKLTSAEMNQLDTDHANSVDKTGDTLTGTVHLNSAGKISADIHDSCISTTDSGISVAVSHGISINHDTGLVLEGSTCWPCFRTARTDTRRIPPAISNISGGAGWTLDGFTATGPGTSSSAVTFEIPDAHNGATLSSLDIIMYVGTSHSAVPSVLPKFEIARLDLSAIGVTPSSLPTLCSTGASSPAPSTGAAWYNLGKTQTWTYTTDQNNVVDNSKYRYIISLYDEGGSNSHSGNAYMGFLAHYTNITNMRFA